jgi:hypothetical protein
MVVRAMFVLLLLSLTAGPVHGQAARFEMDGLAFLAGCWSGTFGADGTMEEFYTKPSRNIILGTTRYIRGDVSVQYEFTRIEGRSDEIVMTPYPGGQPSEDGFTLTSLAESEAIFESPEHDYPKRIIYRGNPDGSRTARIDGGADDPEPTEWILQPVSCPVSR